MKLIFLLSSNVAQYLNTTRTTWLNINLDRKATFKPILLFQSSLASDSKTINRLGNLASWKSILLGYGGENYTIKDSLELWREKTEKETNESDLFLSFPYIILLKCLFLIGINYVLHYWTPEAHKDMKTVLLELFLLGGH